MSVAGNATQSDDDPAMLQSAIGVEQPRSDAAHLRARGKRNHLVKPAIIDCLDIVVDEPDDIALYLVYSCIIKGREIKGLGPRNDSDPGFLRKLRK